MTKSNSDGVILGIDPGSRAMGWGLIRQDGASLRRTAGGVLVPPKSAAPQRLGWILQRLIEIFDANVIDTLAVEAAFVHINPRTALLLGQARGLPIALAAARNIPVHEFPPTVIKRQVVGRGRATKQQVRHMIAAQLGLSELPPEDEADALAVAVTCSRLSRVPTAAGAAGKTAAQLQYEAALRSAGRRRRRR